MRMALVLFCSLVLAACQTTSYSGVKAPKKALLLIQEPGRSMQVRAYIHDTGGVSQNQAFLIKSTTGKTLCDGVYYMDSLYKKGDLTMSCFGGQIAGKGLFINKGKRNGRSYGIGHIESGQSSVKVIYGVTDTEFLKGGPS